MQTTSNGADARRVYLRSPDGSRILGYATPGKAEQIERFAQERSNVRLAVNPASGMVTRVLGNGNGRALKQALERFKLNVDPLDYEPYVPAKWTQWMEDWQGRDERPVRILLYGPEGTGKDTFVKFFIQRIIEQEGADRVVTLWIPPEKEDRWVGNLEDKAKEFLHTVNEASAAGYCVVVCFPEIESLFGGADFVASWQVQFNAALRNVLDGAEKLDAQFLLAAANRLGALGGPLLSRFTTCAMFMDRELAQGILDVHWPKASLDGLASGAILDQLYHEPVAELTLRSRKKEAVLAADLTGFNGRFLKQYTLSLKERAHSAKQDDPDFAPDEAFACAVLREHLDAILAPLVETADTPAVCQFLVKDLRLDPPAAVTPTLGWCEQSTFLAP